MTLTVWVRYAGDSPVMHVGHRCSGNMDAWLLTQSRHGDHWSAWRLGWDVYRHSWRVERRPNDHLVAATFTSSVRLQQYVKLERTHSQYSDLRMTNKKQSIVHATRVIAMIMSTDNNRLLFTVDDVRISLNAKRLLMSAVLHSVLHREAEKGTNFLLCASF